MRETSSARTGCSGECYRVFKASFGGVLAGAGDGDRTRDVQLGKLNVD